MMAPAIVTSTGIRFEQCPKRRHDCESIVNGTHSRRSSGEVHYGQLAGQSTAAIILYGCTNAGAFGLDAIRNAMPEAAIRRFMPAAQVQNVSAPPADAVRRSVTPVPGRSAWISGCATVAQSEPIDV
jgi:hypothetical protein